MSKFNDIHSKKISKSDTLKVSRMSFELLIVHFMPKAEWMTLSLCTGLFHLMKIHPRRRLDFEFRPSGKNLKFAQNVH